MPAAAIARTEDARLNLINTPYPLLDYGVEALWGRREDQDGAAGSAWRTHFAITFRFN